MEKRAKEHFWAGRFRKQAPGEKYICNIDASYRAKLGKMVGLLNAFNGVVLILVCISPVHMHYFYSLIIYLLFKYRHSSVSAQKLGHIQSALHPGLNKCLHDVSVQSFNGCQIRCLEYSLRFLLISTVYYCLFSCWSTRKLWNNNDLPVYRTSNVEKRHLSLPHLALEEMATVYIWSINY